ncbi:MAG: barstar family protein [Pseudarcicella sp.]|jgi:RNAse (barnase) inhibitor barstar|nr:barstar family protein [Pseudarcicella sp.]MBP6410221.1 barstar family protein [Pseudarcicella sp.]
MANFKILKEKSSKQSVFTTSVIYIDGNQNKSITDFYKNISEGLLFPDYFEDNLDSFDELMNDLTWLESEKIYLIFVNYDDFLTDENDEIREIVLTILDDASEDLKKQKTHKRLKIHIEPAEMIEEDLESIGIEYVFEE